MQILSSRGHRGIKTTGDGDKKTQSQQQEKSEVVDIQPAHDGFADQALFSVVHLQAELRMTNCVELVHTFV